MQEISIKSGISGYDPGVSFAVPACELSAGKVFSVSVEEASLYSYIEEKAYGFYAVAYGMIRRILSKFRAYIAGIVINSVFKLFRCRMEQLANAGGLRL